MLSAYLDQSLCTVGSVSAKIVSSYVNEGARLHNLRFLSTLQFGFLIQIMFENTMQCRVITEGHQDVVFYSLKKQ